MTDVDRLIESFLAKSETELLATDQLLNAVHLLLQEIDADGLEALLQPLAPS